MEKKKSVSKKPIKKAETEATVEAKKIAAKVEVTGNRPVYVPASGEVMPIADDTVTLHLSTGKMLRMSRKSAERWVKSHPKDRIIK